MFFFSPDQYTVVVNACFSVRSENPQKSFSVAGLQIRIHFIRIRIQHFRLNTNPDPHPIWIQGFNDQKLKKNYSWKKNLIFFWSKNAIYLSLGLHKVRPSYKRSLQLSKEAIQHFKTWTLKKNFYFCGPFLPSWIRIRIHWPDWIRIQSRSGSGSATLLGRFRKPKSHSRNVQQTPKSHSRYVQKTPKSHCRYVQKTTKSHTRTRISCPVF